MSSGQFPTEGIYDLGTLKKEWAKGKRFNFVYFWNFEKEDVLLENANETCLTQWFPSEFVDENGCKYTCCEQYMMAQKAVLFGDNQTKDRILQATQPREMKDLGRAVRNFNQHKWNENCQQIVYQANLYKFSQNEKLRNYLLSVPMNSIFVEASPYDHIWGIKLSISRAKNKAPSEWKGTNFLGFQLTRVRDFLASQNQ